MNYLLLKLAEEAGEVVVAAVKHRLHGTKATKRALERELGDLNAVTRLLVEGDNLHLGRIEAQYEKRYARETKRLDDN